ncbi:MAG: hypothetical protein M9921_12885 [Fimbriimonadaceae bacterium]|nr:hypothetical protein [Fimbriimonadaceae bacterium]
MALLLVACVLLQSLAPSTYDPNLDRVIPERTGTNGYEEYVDAAILWQQQVREYDAFVRAFERGETLPPRPDGIPEGADVAAMLRIELNVAGPALAKLRAGNAKAVRYPKAISLTTLFPEAAPLKQLVQFMARAAEAEVEAGSSEQAAGLLADGLTFARKFACGGLIIQMVAFACERTLLDSFRRIEAKLPAPTLARFEQIPPLPSPVPALEVARRGVRETFDALLDNPEELKEFLDPKVWPKVQATVADLTATRRDQIYRRYFLRLETPFVDAIRQCGQPEIRWLEPIDEGPVLGDPPKRDLTSDELGVMLPVLRAYSILGVDDIYLDGYLAASFGLQVEDRLFRIHLAILKYRAEHGGWPGSLKAVPGIATVDPCANTPYRYEVLGDAFRLVCDTPRGPLELGTRMSLVHSPAKTTTVPRYPSSDDIGRWGLSVMAAEPQGTR